VLVQRIGRSGHSSAASRRDVCSPSPADELVECAALIDSVRRASSIASFIPEAPLDILAQQIVAAVACEEWREDDLFALVRRAYPYRALPATSSIRSCRCWPRASR